MSSLSEDTQRIISEIKTDPNTIARINGIEVMSLHGVCLYRNVNAKMFGWDLANEANVELDTAVKIWRTSFMGSISLQTFLENTLC